MAKVRVTLTRSLIGRPETQRKTVKSLGLRKRNSVTELPDTPAVRAQGFTQSAAEKIAAAGGKVEVV